MVKTHVILFHESVIHRGCALKGTYAVSPEVRERSSPNFALVVLPFFNLLLMKGAVRNYTLNSIQRS